MISWVAPETPASAFEVHFTRVNADAGLRTNFINCVAQTGEGFIWVGTPNGLHRFDGNVFRQFHTGGPHQLPPLPVDEILSLGAGSKLLVRMGNLIGRFDTSNFRFDTAHIPAPRSQSPRYPYKMYRDHKGQVFLIISGDKILTYNTKNNTFEPNRSLIDYPADVKPTALQSDANGNLWIGSQKGLGVFSPAKQRYFTAADESEFRSILQKTASLKSITNFLIDTKGRLFIRNWPEQNAGLFLIDDKESAPKSLRCEPPGSKTYYELSSLVEKQNVIWAFGMGIFNLYDEASGFTAFYTPGNTDYGIDARHINQIFEDRDKNLWVATDNGLYTMAIIDDHVRNGLVHDLGGANLTNMTALENNRLIFTTWGAGLRIFQYDHQLRLKQDHALEKRIAAGMPGKDQWYKFAWSSCVQPGSGALVIGCQHGRVIDYDDRKQQSTFSTPAIFKESTIRSVTADSQQNLWFGTHSGLIVKRTGTVYRQIADLAHPIAKLHSDKWGRLWVATDGQGIFQYDIKTEKLTGHFTAKANGLSNDRISDLQMVNDSTLAVVATANFDLLNVRTRAVYNYNMYNGLPAGKVTSVQQDERGNLWLSTVSGLCRLDLSNGRFHLFDHSLGLPRMSNYGNLMMNSVRLPGGNLAFCGEKNFVIFDPVKVAVAKPAPRVTITDFKLFERYLPFDSLKRAGVVTLDHDQNFISLDFSAFSYGNEPQPGYYYRLKGAADEWMRSGNNFSAVFPSLKPGEYIFEVKSQNKDGQFSSEVTRLPIRIRPAFWQTWWFTALIVLAVVLPFYAFYLLRLKRLMAIQKIREGVARDLHDDIGSTLTSIAILSEVVSNKLPPAQAEEKAYVGRISASSSQMMDVMDDIVWSIKPDNDYLHRIVARMREFAAVVCEPQGIAYTFESIESDRMLKLRMDDRRNLFLIYKEALTNMAKYAHATKVSIGLTYRSGFMDLRITDNGQGFDTASPSDGNGLSNMQKRAAALSGKLTITSTSAGTEVFVSFPLKRV